MPLPQHVSVLPGECLEWLAPQSGQIFVDGTLGGGGHTRLLAERVGPTGRVLALDRDAAAIAAAETSLAGLPVLVAQANYCDLRTVLDSLQIDAVDGVLLDLGLSSDQLADRQRGFSYEADGPLDMRFDTSRGETAAQWLRRATERELADAIFRYGEERYSRRIARTIVERRRSEPIVTARQLAELVRRCVPRSPGLKIDPATRTFQALRIVVNDELGSLARALERAPGCLKVGGRLAAISFHSLEDRLVKEAFRDDRRWRPLTKKPVRPSEAEVAANSRSRSAKLRVAERVE